MSINPTTNTAEVHLSKADHGMALDGNQRVWRPQEPVDVTEHLPYSPANGAPEHVAEFTHGHKWSEADGKVHRHSGQVEV